MKKGYKGTWDYKCKGQLYEVGQEYKMDEKPIVCSRGFHYCGVAIHVVGYYIYNSAFKLLEIEDLSDETVHEFDKSCSNHIRIIREITDPDELLNLLGVYYEFDSNEHITLQKNCNGTWVKNTYDSHGRMLTYEDSEEYSTERTYNAAGQLLTYKTSDGYYTERTYDDAGIMLTHKDRFLDGDWRVFDSKGKKFIKL